MSLLSPTSRCWLNLKDQKVKVYQIFSIFSSKNYERRPLRVLKKILPFCNDFYKCAFKPGFFFGLSCGLGNNWSCRKIEFWQNFKEFLKIWALSFVNNFSFWQSSTWISIFLAFLFSKFSLKLSSICRKIEFSTNQLSFAEKIGWVLEFVEFSTSWVFLKPPPKKACLNCEI